MKKLAMLLCVIPCLAAPLVAAQQQEPRVLLKENFDGDVSSGLAKNLLAHRHIALAKGAGRDGSDAIRVAYVGYSKGSERVGAQYPLGALLDAATLSFDVCFDKDFQWTHGGKLHGLGPKRAVSGGGVRHPDGWSARIMFQAEGKCSTYLYDQDQEKKWGIGKRSQNPVFTAGQWHRVDLQVRLNTPGEADGSARILIDGKEVVHSPNVMYRGVGGADSQIQHFLFSTFHGGNTSRWTPVDAQGNPATVYALYDNFVVTEGVPE